MGLNNLFRFRPKWQHPDPLVRLAAAKKLRDRNLAQTVFLDIAKTERWGHMRAEAVAQLADESALADIAKADTDSNVRYEAVRKLTDERTLADVAQSDGSMRVRLEATLKLSDQTLLADVLTAEPGEDHYIGDFDSLTHGCDIRFCDVVLPRVTEQMLLAGIAKNGKSTEIRIAAVKRLVDQVVLADVAKAAKCVDARREAILKLKDQMVLAGVAKNDSDLSIRLEAAKKIADQTVAQVMIGDIAIAKLQSSWYDEIRKQAVQFYLTDQAVLTDIAKNDRDPRIRLEAAKKLTDRELSQHILAYLTKEFSDSRQDDFQRVAFEALQTLLASPVNQTLLADVIKSTKGIDVWQAVEKLTDETLLAEIATTHHYYNTRRRAIWKLTDQTVLASIAKADNNVLVRLTAVEQLTDQAVLSDIMANDDSEEVRECAARRRKEIGQ